MTSASPDLLGRKSLYRHLERGLGDLTSLPQAMTAQQGRNHVHVERIFDHDGQVIIGMGGQTVGRWFRSAERPIAYVLLDLKRQRAQAAPNLQSFQSVYNLNVSKMNPGIADRIAYRYGLKVERVTPSRKPRFTIPENAPLQGRVIRLKTKTPFKYRARALLRNLSDRLRFRFIEIPSAVPLQKRPSIRQSWLGYLSKEKNLGKALHELGIPRDQLQGFPTLSRDQRFSRFCNLSTQKALDWIYDRNYQFEAKGPRRDLLFSAEKPQKKQSQPTLKSLIYSHRNATMTVQLGNGKTVTLSLTSGSKEAWNQILSAPLRQHAERSVVQQGFIQREKEGSHIYRRHAIRDPQTLKLTERSRTKDGEVMKIELRGKQTVYCSISDGSPEAVQALLSSKVQMERRRTPMMQNKDQQKRSQRTEKSHLKLIKKPPQQGQKHRRR